MIIYFNPDCSKCNAAVEFMENNNCTVQIRNYLQDPPSVKELAGIVEKLGCKPFDLVRQKEPFFTKHYAGKNLSDTEWLNVLQEHPVLIERPILIDGNKAIIGRPVEKVFEFVKK